MELLELLFSLPDLIAFLVYVFRGLRWLIKGIVTLLGMGVRAVGRGCAWLLDRLRDRERRRDFPTATVIDAARRGAANLHATQQGSPRDDRPRVLQPLR